MLVPAIISVTLYITTTHAQITPTAQPSSWPWYEVPNPQTHPARCGRTEPSWICDPNGILPYRAANEIERQITMTITQSVCPCSRICRRDSNGYMVSVLLLEGFNTSYTGDDQYEKLQRARQFLYSVYTTWMFGRCDEWIVILYSKSQNILYTMTGRRARERITDSTIERISLEVNRYFKGGPSQNITAGLVELIEKYRELLVDAPKNVMQALPLTQGDYESPKDTHTQDDIKPVRAVETSRDESNSHVTKFTFATLFLVILTHFI